MNSLQVFFYEGKEVRIIQRDGEPWWVLKDVCSVLEIGNSRDVTARLDEDEKGVDIIDTLGGCQSLTLINESGLYSLIVQSRKPEARIFKRWVTHEVLPQIRKHGAYITTAKLEELMNDPDAWIKLLTALKEERQQKEMLAAANEDLSVRLNESEKFWTIMKFNQHFNMHWDMKTCQRMGKAASSYSRQHGYEIRKCQSNDERFKETNSYAYEVLETLFLVRQGQQVQ